MISLARFLECVQKNVERITRYQLGGDGRNGGCDCIGLIIGAVRLAGGTWPGTHGSNWAARNAIRGLSPITGAGALFLGEIVFKAKEPGESGYTLPDAYKNSKDKRDYYHVGVVTSLSPLCITHCTGTAGGIKRDKALGKWNWGGELKYVEYGGEPMPVLYEAVVTADNGYPVKMRSQPTTKAAVLASVPLGTVVPVFYDVDETWACIRYGETDGYMMRRFLKRKQEEGQDGMVAVSREDLERICLCLESTLDLIRGALGGNGA